MRATSAVIVLAFLTAASVASGAPTSALVTCHAHFTNQPGFHTAQVAFRITPLPGAHPTAAGLTCARGKAVIQAGFTKFGKKALDYRQIGKLHLTVSGTKYTLALPVPVASGSYAWKCSGTRVQYSLPTGP